MSQIAPFQLQSPTSIEFGVGVAANVGQRASALGMRHALLVTDGALADSAMCHNAHAALEAAGVAATLYSDVVLDPTAESITNAVAAYRTSAADGLVALGGGSAMDTAKALGVLALSGDDDIVPYVFGGTKQVPGMPPLICLPTTAGTGAEITFVSIVTHDNQKKLLRDLRIAPTLALVDPELTLTMPPALTASTGMDALAHALEALTSRVSNPLCDALALDAIERIGRWLPQAVAEGDNLAARSEMSLAALSAGIAFLNARVHLGHAIGHSMGATFKIAHGFACTMCMPALLDFIAPTCSAKLGRVAVALDADDAATAIAALMQQSNAPGLDVALGVGTSDIPRLVEIVQTEDRLIGLSPRQPNAAQWAEIFAASMG